MRLCMNIRFFILVILLTPLTLAAAINPNDCYLEEAEPEIMSSNGTLDYCIEELLQAGIATTQENAYEQVMEEVNKFKDLEHSYLFSIRIKGHKDSIGCLWYIVHGERFAFILRIFIKPEYRSSGIGSHIFTRLEKEFSEKGLYMIRLHAFAHNERALKLYKKLGYNIVSSNKFNDKVIGFFYEKLLPSA